MNQWYVVEKRSYRWIMNKLGCNTARRIKALLIQYSIDIRRGGEAVATQWIDSDERRKKTSLKAKESFAPYWGTQSKRPEVAAKISASKCGDKNPMWGIKGKDHHNWCGGENNWSSKRKMGKEYRKYVFDTLGRKCKKCGTTKNLTIDHQPPWRIIRSHDIKYLNILCESCHYRRPYKKR